MSKRSLTFLIRALLVFRREPHLLLLLPAGNNAIKGNNKHWLWLAGWKVVGGEWEQMTLSCDSYRIVWRKCSVRTVLSPHTIPAWASQTSRFTMVMEVIWLRAVGQQHLWSLRSLGSISDWLIWSYFVCRCNGRFWTFKWKPNSVRKRITVNLSESWHMIILLFLVVSKRTDTEQQNNKCEDL